MLITNCSCQIRLLSHATVICIINLRNPEFGRPPRLLTLCRPYASTEPRLCTEDHDALLLAARYDYGTYILERIYCRCYKTIIQEISPMAHRSRG